MRKLLIVLLVVTGLGCDQKETEKGRHAIPSSQIEWTGESSWVPAVEGEPVTEACEDSLVFSSSGWSCAGESLSALTTFFQEQEERISSVSGDRIERILMNRGAGPEMDSSIPDPRVFVGSASGDTVWIHQFLPVIVKGTGPKGAWSAELQTTYPRNGEIQIQLDGPGSGTWTFAFRQPGWTNNDPDPIARYRWRTNRKLTIDLAGEYIFPELMGGYAYITREWKPGDVLNISFPMSVRRLIYPDGKGGERMSLEVGPVVLATEKNPETLESFPDQGYLQPSEDSSGVSVWDWTVDGVRFEFYRLPESAKSMEVMTDWPYRAN